MGVLVRCLLPEFVLVAKLNRGRGSSGGWQIWSVASENWRCNVWFGCVNDCYVSGGNHLFHWYILCGVWLVDRVGRVNY